MTPIRNEKHETIAYRQDQPEGQVKIRDKHGELVGWTAFGAKTDPRYRTCGVETSTGLRGA